LAALSVLAFDSSYESQTPAVRYPPARLGDAGDQRPWAVLGPLIGAAVVRDPRAGPPPS
jgi:hypothetical protein